VVELVDALRSGRSFRKGVGVQIPPSALFHCTTANYTLPPETPELKKMVFGCSRGRERLLLPHRLSAATRSEQVVDQFSVQAGWVIGTGMNEEYRNLQIDHGAQA
jgi:hypothetical protein